MKRPLSLIQTMQVFTASLAISFSSSTLLQAKPLWKKLIPEARVEVKKNGDLGLTKTNGPWQIMASRFSSADAKQKAEQLALSLRKNHNIPAYVHHKLFQLETNNTLGRGLKTYGAKIIHRYKNGSRFDEYAVLVGDYASIDDERAKKMLKTIKSLKPSFFDSEKSQLTRDNSGSYALKQIRYSQNQIRKQLHGEVRGPMSHAFMTRNPLLPQDYFTPKGIDKTVASYNKGVKYSLLNCPGKYTVKVATFSGKITLIAGSGFSTATRKNKKPKKDLLAEAAQHAHLLTIALRGLGWEAYEFHNRTESYVTVGSFNKIVDRTLPTGEKIPVNDVIKIVHTFGAAYDSPSNLTTGRKPNAATQRNMDKVYKNFTQRMLSNKTQVATGYKPKFLTSSKNGPILLFDIQPHTILAPKRSISTRFAQN